MEIEIPKGDGRLLAFMLDQMETEEERMFVKSFEAYVQYGDDDKAFVISMDDIWQWMGFTAKSSCKRLLISHFTEDVDYQLLQQRSAKQDGPIGETVLWAEVQTQQKPLHRSVEAETPPQNGGQNKETSMMTVNTFKELCMIAKTEQATNVRKYYLKMERIVQKRIVDELKKQLIEQGTQNQLRVERARHLSLIEAFTQQSLVYFVKVRQLDDTRWILKIGATNDISKRIKGLLNYFGMAVLIDAIPCVKNYDFESFLHNHPDHMSIQCFEDVQPGVRSTETFYVDDSIYGKVLAVAKRNVSNYAGLDTEQYMEINRIQLQRQQLDVELKKYDFEMDQLQVRRLELNLEFKRYEMLEKGIDAPQQQQPLSQKSKTQQQPVSSYIEPPKVGGDGDGESDVDEADARMMMMIGSRQLAKGFKIQRYNVDGTLVETYQGEVDVLRRFPGITPALLKRAIQTQTVYKDFRWMFLSKDKSNNEVQEIGDAHGTVQDQYRLGPIAVLMLDKSRIVQVFTTQKSVAEHFKFKGNSAVSQALKRKNICRGHYLQMWDDCNTDLQEDFLSRHCLPDPPSHGSGQQVAKLHPITLKPLKIYTSYGHATRINHFGSKTLRRAIADGEMLQGFRWKVVDR